MTQADSNPSGCETRKGSSSVMRRSVLPLLLALVLFILPFIPAGMLDSKANACTAQAQSEREQLWQQWNETPSEERDEKLGDLVFEAYVREGQLEADASEYRLYSKLLRFAGLVMGGAVVAITRRKAIQ